MNPKKFLPFALPSLGEEEIQEVTDTLRSGWLTTGLKTARFEKDFSQFIGVDHALAVNSATSGLHLALEAIGVGRGDKVITTPYTFTATAEVIRYLGADPILVDIDPRTFNIDPDKIREIASQHDNIKAIMPVHFAGQSCEMDAIRAIANEYNWKIVEDAAHALPTTWQGEMVGTLSDITVYSFYTTKTIATGEGGMVVSNNEDYIERMKVMRLHGMSRDAFDRYTSNKPSWFYEIVEPGYKYNMTDIAASLGIHQLKKAKDFQERREWIAVQYNTAFADLPLQIPFVAYPDDTHAWHLYVIQLELDSLTITRDQFIELMAEEGIATSVHFIPLHLHPYWKDRYNYNAEDFPVSLTVFNRVVSLPIYPKMTDEDVKRVITAVRKILTHS
ncbi:MAG: DegT/DnrJ/EryC1/StrS family aminotransferase [Thiotrichaceae bacterium]|nr:DegT/DnrJ/EryC1/StrS family aminotransferase [Thiotrichaceae bacterium]